MNNLNSASADLIIILSIVLIIFLVVLIVAIAKLVQVLNSMKRVAQKAEKIAESAESIGQFLANSTGPMALGRMLGHLTDFITKRKKGSK